MKNVGGFERVARVIAGSALLSVGLFRRGWWGLAALAGADLLYTAGTQYCPINRVLGIDTFRGEDRKLHATQKPVVQEASEESFPASDSPAWTVGTPS